jgi:hypothetical protein
VPSKNNVTSIYAGCYLFALPGPETLPLWYQKQHFISTGALLFWGKSLRLFGTILLCIGLNKFHILHDGFIASPAVLLICDPGQYNWIKKSQNMPV